MALPKWVKMMGRSKTVEDYIVTSLCGHKRTLQAVRHAFCTGARAGDLIVFAIIKKRKSGER